VLNTYITATQNLLQNPTATNPLYATNNLITYINTARGQLAGEGRCIRRIGTLALAAGVQEYQFSAISLQSPAGVGGVININQAMLQVASGYRWMRPRPFQWLVFYRLNNPVPQTGAPNEWAQFGQGASPQTGLQASGGSLYVSNLPDIAYSVWLDCVCYPSPLASDTDPEPIPYLWTDAVSYFAAYLALLSAQSQARQADADRMLARYSEFVNRARNFANPEILQGIYSQAPNPVMQNQIGVSGKAG
jgi:hypothetical protein